MQRPSDIKRDAIIRAAAGMFSRRSFHEVRLDDVARHARIGKGTVYIYFKSKEDLYDTLVLESLERIEHELKELADARDADAWETLERMVAALVNWAHGNPHFFEMMRQTSAERVPKLRRKRQRVGEQFARVLKRGNRTRQFHDPLPQVTAQSIPAIVRSAMKFGPRGLAPARLTSHVLHLLRHGIRRTK